MSGFVPVERILNGHHADTSVCAVSENGAHTWGELRCLAAIIHAKLNQQSADQIVIALRDGWQFAATFLAAVAHGVTIILPPNQQPATLAEFPRQLVIDRKLLAKLVADTDQGEECRITVAPTSSQQTRVVFYTSGSTGRAAAVTKSLQQLNAELEGLGKLFAADLARATVLSTVPPHHIYGLIFRLLLPLSTGQVWATRDHVYPEELAGLSAQRDRVVLVSSPAFLGRLKKFDMQMIRRWPVIAVFCSGGPLTGADAEYVRAAWGRYPYEIYGSTETGGIAWRKRSIGNREPEWKCFAKTSIQSRRGGLWVKSANTDGRWSRTGDRVEMTTAGFRLLGRIDQVVKIEEKRVSLDQMSTRLKAYPALSDVRIIQRRKKGRVILAVAAQLTVNGAKTIRESGKTALDREMRRYLRDFYPAVVVPRQWIYLDQLPENAQGKISHADIEALFQSEPSDADHGSTQPSLARQLLPLERRIEISADTVDVELGLSEHLEYFRGHFPGQPILPGVVQLDWAIQYCDRFFNTGLAVSSIAGLKFHAVIIPGMKLVLKLRWNERRRCCSFSYVGETRHASGKIQFPGG